MGALGPVGWTFLEFRDPGLEHVRFPRWPAHGADTIRREGGGRLGHPGAVRPRVTADDGDLQPRATDGAQRGGGGPAPDAIPSRPTMSQTRADERGDTGCDRTRRTCTGSYVT